MELVGQKASSIELSSHPGDMDELLDSVEFLNIGETLSRASNASIQKEFFTEELDILSSSESLLLLEDIIN